MFLIAPLNVPLPPLLPIVKAVANEETFLTVPLPVSASILADAPPTWKVAPAPTSTLAVLGMTVPASGRKMKLLIV